MQMSVETRSAVARPFHARQQAVWDAQRVQVLSARTVPVVREIGRNAHGTTLIQYTGSVTRA
eukprot:2618986-Lingulodinium_polyedra.AAC.1